MSEHSPVAVLPPEDTGAEGMSDEHIAEQTWRNVDPHEVEAKRQTDIEASVAEMDEAQPWRNPSKTSEVALANYSVAREQAENPRFFGPKERIGAPAKPPQTRVEAERAASAEQVANDTWRAAAEEPSSETIVAEQRARAARMAEEAFESSESDMAKTGLRQRLSDLRRRGHQ
jgi:hypothetical protein